MMKLTNAAERTVEGRVMDAFRPVGGEFDFCTRDGATILKQKIEAYWRERGHNVQVLLHNVGFHPAIRAARYDVRSDMVNGLPRHGKARTAQPESLVGIDALSEIDAE